MIEWKGKREREDYQVIKEIKIEPMGDGNVHQFLGRRRRKTLIGGEPRPHVERQTGMRKRWGKCGWYNKK